MKLDLNFDKQFSRKQFISTQFGEIETVDLVPTELKTPIPVLFAPGWRETPELQKDCLYEVYKNKRKVISLNHTTTAFKLDKFNKFPVIELQKALTLIEILRQKNIKNADVITHSEGAINVAIAATLQPQLFRNLVLVTPAGLHGKDSVIRLAYGFSQHMSGQLFQSFAMVRKYLRRRSNKKGTNLIKSMLLALQEGKAIATFDIYPLLLALKKEGIKVAVLVGENDTTIPYKKVKLHLLKNALSPHYGFDIFATKPGGHELYSKPTEIMPTVENILVKLEEIN